MIHVKASDCDNSVARAKKVESCPRTEKEWKAASERKKCYNNKNDCFRNRCKDKYHCVINEWRNETVEVCGKRRLIICEKF